jgi:hypothetical protein
LAQTSASAENSSIATLEQIYSNSFTIYFGFSLVAFVLCLLAIRPINKLIQGTTHD